MADITMCKPKYCDLYSSCYRYITEPHSIMQSYFIDEPYDKKTKTCDYYYETKSTTKNIQGDELLLQDGPQL
jgi:hypothetical protein